MAASFTTPGGQDPAWEQREQGPAAAQGGCLLWGGTAVWATGQALTLPTVPMGTVPPLLSALGCTQPVLQEGLGQSRERWGQDRRSRRQLVDSGPCYRLSVAEQGAP